KFPRTVIPTYAADEISTKPASCGRSKHTVKSQSVLTSTRARHLKLIDDALLYWQIVPHEFGIHSKVRSKIRAASYHKVSTSAGKISCRAEWKSRAATNIEVPAWNFLRSKSSCKAENDKGK